MNSFSRRNFLKSAGALAAGTALPPGLARATPPSIVRANPLPRWRGFNLQYLYNTRRGLEAPQEDHFRWIAGWGFDYVRLPTTYRAWLKAKTDKIQPEDVYQIDESALELLDQAVTYGERHGVHVNLCLHTAPGYRVGKSNNEPFVLWRDQSAVEAFTFHWKMLANRYRAVGRDKISFNLFNEAPWPSDEFNGQIYLLAVAPAVDAIRRISPDRLIIADGMGAGNLCVPELIPLGVHQSVHCYIPGNVSHYKVDWMKDRTDWPEPKWPGGAGKDNYVWDRQRLVDYYTPWRSLIEQGIGVHLGETGASHRLPYPVFTGWLGDVLSICREMNIGWALWDFMGNSRFGILDTERADVAYEDWYGHKLDRKMLQLLQAS